MEKNFKRSDWQAYIPTPVCEAFPNYENFYNKAWELAHAHVKEIDGMPQTPYMDEAFCDSQIWIWDTCFMVLFCKFAQEVFPGVETFRNFYETLYGEKSFPEIIATESEPWWTGAVAGQSMPIKIHLADNPPLFAWAEYENALLHGDLEYLKKLLYERKFLQKHYEWFESLTESVKLPVVRCKTNVKREQNGYKWEGGSSGMDNTPRGRLGQNAKEKRPNNPDMLWIDAICQQALAAKSIARLFSLLGDKENAAEWETRFLEKQKLVNELYWDETDGFYYDINCNDGHFYKVKTVASYWPLTAGIASKEQAKLLTDLTNDPQTFGGDVPLISLARNDADFCESGNYWRGSLWLPTAYAALKGLAQYGFFDEAHSAGYRIFKHMLETYENYEPHTIWEAYSPTKPRPATSEDGVRTVRKDFCGWSALGPIAIYLEYVLGFHTINAFERVVEWSKPKDIQGKIGVKNLRFGDVVTDIIADGANCFVQSNAPYSLKIDGKIFAVVAGENRFTING